MPNELSGYDSLEDVWRWTCPACLRELTGWSMHGLEFRVERHEELAHGITPSPNASPF